MRARREPEEERRTFRCRAMMKPGTRTTATSRTRQGRGSMTTARRARTRAGEAKAAAVGARKVWRYRATRSAPSVSRETVEPERRSAARAGPRSNRCASRRERRRPSSRAAEVRERASTTIWQAPDTAAASTAWRRSGRQAPGAVAPEPAASRAPRPRPRPTSAQAWARELRTASAKEAASARRPRTVPMGIVGVVEPRPWARAMPASRDALVVKGIEGRTRT